MAPLDIALAAAELEELAGIDLSAEALGSVATVGDLSWVFLSTLQGLQPETVDPSHRARRG